MAWRPMGPLMAWRPMGPYRAWCPLGSSPAYDDTISMHVCRSVHSAPVIILFNGDALPNFIASWPVPPACELEGPSTQCCTLSPATDIHFNCRFLSSRQEKGRFDYWQSIMPDLDPPTLGDTEICRGRGGQELMLTLPYLSPLKFVGRLFTGILS